MTLGDLRYDAQVSLMLSMHFPIMTLSQESENAGVVMESVLAVFYVADLLPYRPLASGRRAVW